MREGWRETALGDLYALETARRMPGDLDPTTPYIGLEHLEAGKRWPRMSADLSGLSSAVTPFKRGATLFGRLRPYLSKVALAPGPGVCTPEILVLHPRQNLVVPSFLHALGSSERVIRRCVEMSAGSRMPRTAAADLASIPVLLPPLAEQRRIVDLIAAVDEAIEAATISERAGARLEAALVDEIFAAPDVKPCPLKDFCEPGGIQIGPFGSQLHAADYRPEGIPSIMPRDIVGGVINRGSLARVSEEKAASLDRHRLVEGDILLSRRGDLRKRAMVGSAEAGWLCGTGTVRIRPKVTLEPSALYRALSTEAVNGWLSDRSVGATMPNLNTAIVESIPVRLPAEPRIPMLVIDAVTATTRSVAVEMSSLVLLRAALLGDLLSGEHQIPPSYDELLSA